MGAHTIVARSVSRRADLGNYMYVYMYMYMYMCMCMHMYMYMYMYMPTDSLGMSSWAS